MMDRSRYFDEEGFEDAEVGEDMVDREIFEFLDRFDEDFVVYIRLVSNSRYHLPQPSSNRRNQSAHRTRHKPSISFLPILFLFFSVRSSYSHLFCPRLFVERNQADKTRFQPRNDLLANPSSLADHRHPHLPPRMQPSNPIHLDHSFSHWEDHRRVEGESQGQREGDDCRLGTASPGIKTSGSGDVLGKSSLRYLLMARLD